MKIAVQFYGHLRTWKYCLPTIKALLLDRYNCDVFMHTWSETEARTKSWHNYKMKRIDPVDYKIVNELKTNYNITDILVENQTPPDKEELIACQHSKDGNAVSTVGIRYMFHSKKRVNELRQKYQAANHVKYDWVIVLRPDIMIFNYLDLHLLERELKCVGEDPHARYCGPNTTLPPMKEFAFPIDSASDVFYLARPQVIDQVTELLYNIDFKKVDQIWNPESYFNKVLQENGIPTIALTFLRGRDWNVVRESSAYVKNIQNKQSAASTSRKEVKEESTQQTKQAASIPDQEVIRDIIHQRRLYLHYMKCRLLSKLLWGKKRKHYFYKKKMLRNRLDVVHLFLQSL